MAAPLVSRRTTLGSALAAPVLLPLALGGCDLDPPRGEPSPGASTPPPEDSALVASVVAELVRAEAVVAAAVAAVPGLAERLGPVGAAHRGPPRGPRGRRPRRGPADGARRDRGARIVAALRTVGRSEQRLLRSVREACTGAASGDLARVLASVAASTSQHAAALSTQVTS
ncbi:hypothetical protein [Nocardioides okcheonensis]|uniref:hypothetical protein n=1 Tax=Nocardioides okcheonensis TaxID=2894081 RepID=UPI001E437D23|nr:hypothetical protein [Nocardioides okcheonensis]UFN45679.1 hypothetical protein LN652_05565 [Nocardioides okcheonensis]